MKKSLIIVASPFQLLCAINAIREYSILEYKIILIQSERLDQMEDIAKYFKLKWEVQPPIVFKKKFGTLRLAKKALHPLKNNYDNLIVGDVRDVNLMLKGLSIGKLFKKIIIVDDGNIMLSYFSGTMITSFRSKIYWQLLQFVAKLRKITIEYFTIYNADSSKFNIKKNHLQLQNSNNAKKEVIFFVGTNSHVHCDYYGYKKEMYLDILKAILSKIANESTTQIEYIAHGRESFPDVKSICDSLAISYVRPKNCIELYVLENNIDLKYVYGFGSSALYNLKLIYPNANVYNIKLFGNDKSKIAEMDSVSKAYNSIGIEDYDLEIIYQ